MILMARAMSAGIKLNFHFCMRSFSSPFRSFLILFHLVSVLKDRKGERQEVRKLYDYASACFLGTVQQGASHQECTIVGQIVAKQPLGFIHIGQ